MIDDDICAQRRRRRRSGPRLLAQQRRRARRPSAALDARRPRRPQRRERRGARLPRQRRRPRARRWQALTSASEDDVRVAQVYLRHRPIDRRRRAARADRRDRAHDAIAKAQVRALETLARLGSPIARASRPWLACFPVAESAGVQTAIAGVLLRADADAIADPELVQSLRERRLSRRAASDAHRRALASHSTRHLISRRTNPLAQDERAIRAGSCAADDACILRRPLLPASRSMSLRKSGFARRASWRVLVSRASCRRRPEDGLHDHRQFARREGSAAPQPARRTTIGSSSSSSAAAPTGSRPHAAPAFAATCSSSPAISTAAPSSTPIGWTQRESLPVDEMRARRVQRLVPRPVLAAQGGLPVRLQHAERRRAAQRRGGDRAQPRARGPFAGRCRARVARCSTERYGESNRDRMRQIFKDVPVIYGFSAKAPLGRDAAPTLDRYLQRRRPRVRRPASASAKLLGPLRAGVDDASRPA